MKILHTVEFYPPSVGGMQEVVKQLSERLAAFGHEMTVATTKLPMRSSETINGVRVVQFDVRGNFALGMSGEVEKYQRFLLESKFDVITNFAAQQWATDLALPLLSQIPGCKVFVPTGFSGLTSSRFQKYFQELPQYLKQYDMHVFLSETYRDVVFVRNHGISKQMLIPNGAAADEFLISQLDIRPRLGILPDHFLILHVGSHTGLKGHEEAMAIFQRAKISSATLLVVGRDDSGGCSAVCRERAAKLNGSAAFRHDGKKIIMMELSREDTVAAYQAADLFLFPSLIECSPIVLFECMASRTPFLASNAGNCAEIIEWSGGGQLLPTEQRSTLRHVVTLMLGRKRIGDDFGAVHVDISDSAELLAALYRDPVRRQTMAQAGFTAWQQHFTWEKIAVKYEELYLSLSADKRL